MCNPVTVIHPDALLEKGTHLGYEWEVTSNRIGYRCGYIRVPHGHPWHGKNYDEVDAEVHGGLTFAAADLNCGKGGADDAWWLGFDCAHFGDAPDPSLPGNLPGQLRLLAGTIRTTEYVAGECRRLIDQAVLPMYVVRLVEIAG